MLKKYLVAAAVAAATLAMASPAFAATVTLNSANNEFQFGDYGSCAPGLAPAAPAHLYWHESANGQSVRPEIEGDLCLQNTNAEARVAVVYHQAGGQPITKYSSSPATGNGGPLNAFFVDAIGARVATAVLDHVHVQIEERNAAGGWDTVPGAELVMYP